MWGTCRSSPHARHSKGGAPRSLSRTVTRRAWCAARASAAASSPIRLPAGPSSLSATARATDTQPAIAMSCGPSGAWCGSASRRAGSFDAGRSSARSTRGWRRSWRAGGRIQPATRSAALARSSAARRSGGTDCWTRRPEPGRPPGGGQPVIDCDERGDVDRLGVVEGPQDHGRAGVLAVEDLEVDVGEFERGIRLTESSRLVWRDARPAR